MNQLDEKAVTVGGTYRVERQNVDDIMAALGGRRYCIYGPTVRSGAILYDEVHSAGDLPVGWTDEQSGGSYRLVSRNDSALFGYNVGPHTWKGLLHPPVLKLYRVKRTDRGFRTDRAQPDVNPTTEIQKLAFFGVRSCELNAILITDTVLGRGPYVDPYYRMVRENLFILAVNCTQSGGTCFCVSMNTGPKVEGGHDLAMTEIVEGGEHFFIVEVGSEKGAEVMTEVPRSNASPEDRAAADERVGATAERMGRALETKGLKDLLYASYDHPRWETVARRCLTCANCTMVCPTCFCTTVEDTTDLAGDHAERLRKWDSCFTLDFSYIHGGSVRATPKSRYRQWLMHKLATWIDQFGTSGCVGCGRCITWCPVGIDITEEVAAIRKSQTRDGSRVVPEGTYGNT